MTPDSNTSRYLPPTPRPGTVPGRTLPGDSPRSPVELAAALRGCADELADGSLATGMTASRAAGLMREAAGMIVVMVAVVEG